MPLPPGNVVAAPRLTEHVALNRESARCHILEYKINPTASTAMPPNQSSLTAAALRLPTQKPPRVRQREAGHAPVEAGTPETFLKWQVQKTELKRQNADLQEARNKLETGLEKYTDLYDFAPVGYFCLDAQGRILEVNLTGATLLGVDRSRLIRRRLQRFVTPPCRPEFLAFLNKVFTEPAEQVYQASLKLEDGVVFWANLQAVKADSRQGEEWCRVTISNITGLKQAEEGLRSSCALFSALIQQAPMGIYVVDERLRLLQVNSRAQPVFTKIHPLIGRYLGEIIRILWPHPFADQVLEHFQHTVKTGQPYGLSTFTERRRDTGLTEAYEWQIQRIALPAGRHGVVCFFTDITERKEAEATLCRMAVLAATNRKLEQEIMARQAVEKNLTKSKLQQAQLLAHSQHIQEQLRRLSHQVLQAQETERKRISRELNGDIAQTLAGINDNLATLAREPRLRINGFQQRMLQTQKLVADSVDIVHRFAHDLRSTMMDGQGLIPALRAHLNKFAKRTKIRIRFTPLAPDHLRGKTVNSALGFETAHIALPSSGPRPIGARASVGADNPLADRVADVLANFVRWLDRYGELSWDHQSFYAGPLGRWSKALYYQNKILGTVAVAPAVFCEAFLPGARRLFHQPIRLPIADAHFAMGFALLHEVTGDKAHLAKADHFLNVLKETHCAGFEEYCWGYPFDWVTRNGVIEKGTPLITTTPYVFEAFLQVDQLEPGEDRKRILESITRHVLTDIKDFARSETGSTCSYTPFDQGGIVNASAYRAFMLTSAASQFSNEDCLAVAGRNLNFVLETQNANGSWPYAVDGVRDFVDHFHTCFVMKSLAKIHLLAGGERILDALKRGVDYYLAQLFSSDGMPRPFSRPPRLTVYQCELYDCAECINLCLLLRQHFPELQTTLETVVAGILKNWIKPDGSFRSRKLMFGWDNVPMHRWAQAQMFRSLSFYLREARRTKVTFSN